MNTIAAVILQNPQGEILLYLRDNKPSIPFPHHWDLFGGHVEEGETVEEALVREVKEELDLNLKEYHFFRRYDVLEGDAKPNTKFVYYATIEQGIDELVLYEGEELRFFSREDIPHVKFANVLKGIVMDFIQSSVP